MRPIKTNASGIALALKATPLSVLAVIACAILAVAWAGWSPAARAQARVTIYEGARLIDGNGGAPIEDSAFIVENGRFVRVGRRGQLQAPAGATHVILTGKTVMPAMIDLHGHFGFQHVAEGRMSKSYFTRENLIEHMERLAYVGVGGAVGVGDLVDRSDLKGGRTGWGRVVLDLRDKVIPNAAIAKTAGPGMAWPGSGPQGDPSRVDVPYEVMTPDKAREAVDDYVKIKPLFIKLWVDDRGGTKKTLTPELYEAILREAHKFNVPVAVHNVTLANAKLMFRYGMEGWLHVPVRNGEEVDDELLAIVKQRIARKDRPVMWMTPALITAWMDTYGGTRPAWLNDPLLHDLYSPSQIEEYWGAPLSKRTAAEAAASKKDFELQGRNAMKLRAAGMTMVGGTDTGQNRYLIGWFNHIDLESMVAIGLTPLQAITAATRDGAKIAGFNAGLVAPGKSADFIVLDANPLESIGNTRKINKVYLRGQEVDRAALRAKFQAEMQQAAQSIGR